MSSQKPKREIPLYRYDDSLIEYTNAARIERLERCGRLSRVVRHKKGTINRAVMRPREGEPKPTELRDHVGQRYSFREHLDDGHRPWKLKRLGEGDELRPIFLRVLTDCLASGNA